MAKWVYRLSDGLISHRSQYSDATKTGNIYAIVDLPDYVTVDLDNHRIDLATKQLRNATNTELEARRNELYQQLVDNDASKLDILTTITWIIRREIGPAQFDAMTNAQKKQTIMNQVQVWKNIRSVIESMLNG